MENEGEKALRKSAAHCLRQAALAAFVLLTAALALCALTMTARNEVGDNIMLQTVTLVREPLLRSLLLSLAALAALLGVLLEIGYISYHLGIRRGREMPYLTLFDGFSFAGKVILLYIVQYIFIFLWSLLLFIPGIVKAYAYSMVYYVKADHPEYGWRECLDESQRLMTGHKWEKFVLDLSFIGWGIVGSLCLGVGTLWVMTYMAATEAQYYEYLTSGRTSPEF